MGWMIKNENYTGIIKLSFVKKEEPEYGNQLQDFGTRFFP